jgi:hypothetical protein
MMPTVVSGNASAACIMVGEKGVDLMLRSAVGIGGGLGGRSRLNPPAVEVAAGFDAGWAATALG